MDERQRVAGRERRNAGRQFVQQRAQRVQICTLINGAADTANLLGSQILQGPRNVVRMMKFRPNFSDRRSQREVDQARDGTRRGQDDV